MERQPLRPGRIPPKKRTRRTEDASPYIVGHPIKLEALIALHERETSPGEIAAMLGEELNTVSNHVRDLYEAGSIEFVGRKGDGDGNIQRTLYREVAPPRVNDEEHRAMSQEERHDASGILVQWILAELLSSHRNGKMDDDEDVCLLSDEPTLDAEGRRELRGLLEASWNGEITDSDARRSILEIEDMAAKRMADSGETGATVVVALLAFERGRSRGCEGLTPRVRKV